MNIDHERHTYGAKVTWDEAHGALPFTMPLDLFQYAGQRILCVHDTDGRWHFGTALSLGLVDGTERWLVDLDDAPYGTIVMIPRKDMLLMSEALSRYWLDFSPEQQQHLWNSKATWAFYDIEFKDKPERAAQRIANNLIMERHIEFILRQLAAAKGG